MPSKSRRRPVSTDRRFRKQPNAADHGPPERWQHSGRLLEITERRGVLAARVTEEHVIDILLLRGVLSKTQGTAAIKFKLGLSARRSRRAYHGGIQSSACGYRSFSRLPRPQ